MSTPTDTSTPSTPPATAGSPLAAAQPQCAFMIPTGTENGGQRVLKQCVKLLKPGGLPHDGEHSLRSRVVVDTSKIKADALKLEKVPTSETVDGLTERVRDELQQSIDAMVLAAHQEWIDAGKKTGFNEIIASGAGQRFFIEPDEAEAYKKLLRLAAGFHTTNGTPIHVRVIPPKVHTDGRTMLYWAAVDKRELTEDEKAKAKAKRDATKAAKEAEAAKAKAEAEKAAKAAEKETPKPAPPKR